MADNIYVFEDFMVPAQTRSTTDDGSGNDWLTVSGNYIGTGDQAGLRIFLSINTAFNLSLNPDYAAAQQINGTGTAEVDVFGTIENAMGGGGNESIYGTLLGNILQGDGMDMAGGNDTLFGYAGSDTLYGMGGSDVLSGDEDNDLIFGDDDPSGQGAGNIAPGDDTLNGGLGNDTLFGGYGHNALNGDSGFDQASYSGFFDDFGNYTYSVLVMLYDGTATVRARDSFDGSITVVAQDVLTGIERVDGTGGNDTMIGFGPSALGEFNGCEFHGGDGNDSLTGDSGIDALYGGNGTDTLDDGGNTVLTGNDVLNGGAGDDYYTVRSSTTRVIENAATDGYDRVFCYATSFTLPRYVEVLYLFSIGGGGQSGTGNNLNNQLEGNEIANTLSGLGGNDYILGYAGRDSLLGGGGNDTLVGGTEADKLYGGVQADSLYGDSGADWLYGGADADQLFGGGQSDHLYGGAGADRLTGGAGSDYFVFAKGDAGTGTQRDTITDFVTTVDKIDLKAIMPNQIFIQSSGFHHIAGEVRYVAATGILAGDTDGKGGADYQIFLGANHVLVAADLIL